MSKWLFYILPLFTFSQDLIYKPTIKKGLAYKCEVAVLNKPLYKVDYVRGNNTVIYLAEKTVIAISDNVEGVRAICNKEPNTEAKIIMKKCEKINTVVCENVKVEYPNGCEL